MEGDKVVEDVVVIADHTAKVTGETLITSMINKIMDKAAVKDKETFKIIRAEVKIDHFQVGKDSGITATLIVETGTIGIEMEVVKATIMIIREEDGKAVEVKVKMIEGEGENGILTLSTHSNNTLTQIITNCHQWVINTDTQYHMNSILHIHLNHNTQGKDHQPNHSKLQIYANCVKIRAIMIINANLLVILWPQHKKHLIKGSHITIRILIKETGQLGSMITMTPMDSLFSNRGSRCC